MSPLLLAFLTVAVAEPVSDPISRSAYLRATGRVELALVETAARVRDDPDSLAAHRDWALTWVSGARASDALEGLYDAWRTAEPDAHIPRLMRAELALWLAPKSMGPWCDPATALLADPIPEDPLLAATTWRLRHELFKTCPGDAAGAAQVLLGPVGDAVPATQLRLRASDGAWSAADAVAQAAYLASHPLRARWHLEALQGNASGPGLAAARANLRDLGGALEAQSDPVALWVAESILRRDHRDEHANAVQMRRLQADPEADEVGVRSAWADGHLVRWTPRDPWDPLLAMRLRGAARRTPRASERVLMELDASVPATGPLRQAWLRYVAEAHDRRWLGGRPLDHWLAAVEADPTDPQAALGLAAAAVTSGMHLDLALTAVRIARTPPVWDPRGAHDAPTWDAWREWRAGLQGDLWCAEAELLRASGQPGEAADAAQHALLLGEDAHRHLVAGTIAAAAGEDHAALLHLGRGLALDDGSAPASLVREARRAATRLLDDVTWAPTLELWITSMAPPPHAASGPTPSTEHYRVGTQFPDLNVVRDDRSLRLSELPGVRVVELWASWCGPCVASLPMLDDIAKRYADRGVTVWVLGVDADRRDFEAFRRFGPHHQVAWTGTDALDAAKVSGIPATFVLDADGVVRAFHSGYRGGDWLDDALQTLLDR